MFSALISFLGGSLFRTIWGELSSFLNKKQDHEHELAMMQAQAAHDDSVHARMLESLKMQAELGVKQIEVQTASAASKADAEAFTAAMTEVWKPTGIFLVDAWNGVIRPAAASIVLVLWVLKLTAQNFVMQDYDMEISSVVLGFFFADRGLAKRGK